jgi:hypothetical protein
MRESERLAEQGIRLLHQAGWPKDAIEELVTTLMGAGMAKRMEDEIAEAQRNELLIQKVTAN